VADARFEIWFPSTEEVSIFTEIADTGEGREGNAIGLWAAFAARQIANLKRDAGMHAMCVLLAELEHTDEMPDAVGETRIVPPTPSQGRKGFVGTFVSKDGLPLINVKPKGFGMMGRGVGFYAPTATLALFLDLHGRSSETARFVLTETARGIGLLALDGKIGVTSQAKAAGLALAFGVERLHEELGDDDAP
jgi:hypothetical protein